MNEALLREVAQKYLVPFFSGAKLEPNALPSRPTEMTVVFGDEERKSILFKVSRSDSYRLILHRPQPFAHFGPDVALRELAVVRAFVATLAPLEDHLDNPELKDDLLSTFQRRVVAAAVVAESRRSTVLRGIDQMKSWAARLYEGSPVTAAIGFRNSDHGILKLEAIGERDFAHVLGNGYDTLLEFDFDGRFVDHTALRHADDSNFRAPLRQVRIADWTTAYGAKTRVALSLNRLGEILVYRRGQLLFAYRSGVWHFLTHDPVVTQMTVRIHRPVRRAVYATCLDASFARTGACIGLVRTNQGADWEAVVDPEDRLSTGMSVKAKALRKIIGERKFQDLDRRLRQELVAIDGATLIAEDGVVLAIGAILQIGPGSSGGGRLAAAKRLSELGVGIKVSQDGSIAGFRSGDEPGVPSFRVM